MATLSPKLGLVLPSAHESGWGGKFNADFARLDALAAVGDFAIRPAAPSTADGSATDRTFVIEGGLYVDATGAHAAVASSGVLAADASATTYAWLGADGAFHVGTAYPTTAHARVGRVACDASKITGYVDDRRPLALVGGGGSSFGSMKVAVTDVTLPTGGTYQALPTDQYLNVSAAGGATTVLLYNPGSTDEGRFLVVRKADATANAVEVYFPGQRLSGVTLSAKDACIWWLGLGDETWLKASTPP